MTLREAFLAVYDRHGALTARLIVEEAREGTDEVAERLRDALPWDAEDGLYHYQLAAAQKLIRKMRIVYKPTPKSTLRETRAFVSVPAADGRPAVDGRPVAEGRAYHPTAVVAEDPFMSRLLLQDAERQWRDLKARYGNLRGFIEMVRRDVEGEAAA